jgi:uncharacterized membrane protein
MVDRVMPKLFKEHGIVAVIFLLGLSMRLYLLGFPSFDAAEILTAVWSRDSLINTIEEIRHSEFPPLYYLIVNLWLGLFGVSEHTVRFPSVIFSSLTIILIYKLGVELFTKRIGITAALLLAVSPFSLIYAQYAKMYALFWFLVSASFLYFFRFLKDGQRSSFVSYIMCSILSCYTLYTGFLLLAAQSCIFMLWAEKSRWKKWFLGQMAIIAVCLPWLIYFLNSSHGLWSSLRPENSAFNYVYFLAGAFLFMIGSCRFNSPVDGTGVLNSLLYASIIFLPFIKFIYAKIKQEKFLLSKNVSCLLMWMAIPTLMYFLFDCLFVPVELEERYVGFLHVPFMLLVSAHIDQWHNASRRLLVLAIIILIAASNIRAYFKKDLVHPRHDWRKTSVELTYAAKDGGIIVSFVHPAIIEYYFQGDTNRLFEMSMDDFSLEALVSQGILTSEINSIFVIYNQRKTPEIHLKDFYIQKNVAYGKSGFLHFKRLPQ